MRRRDFITLLGGAAAWPLAARAQQPKVPVIGYLHFGIRDGNGQIASFHIASFHRGLREVGFIEGQNIAVEYQFAENREERAQALAADLVRQQVALVVAAPSTPAIGAAKAATTTIPIVFMSGPDPVRTGLVASLNRPGGNLTGVTQLSADLTPKRLGLLHDLAPHAMSIAVLKGRGPRQDDQLETAQRAGRAVGLRIFGIEAGDPSEFDAAFASATREGAGALLVATNLIFVENRKRLAALAVGYKLPAIYQAREFAAAGGLMSYGPSTAELFRQIGRYAGRILKGEKPVDLPVLLPTQFEFIINLQAAKALGLDIPPGVLAIADEVIE